MTGTNSPDTYNHLYGGVSKYNFGPSLSLEPSFSANSRLAMSPILGRRYSISGLPSTSISDPLYSSNLYHQHQLNNTVNDICQSKSQLLINKRLSESLSAITGTGSGLTYDSLNFPRNYQLFDNSNMAPLSVNFLSQPNIYSQPNIDYDNYFNKYNSLKLKSKPMFNDTTSSSNVLGQTNSLLHKPASYNKYSNYSSQLNNYHSINHSYPSSQSFTPKYYHQHHYHHSSNPAISHTINYSPCNKIRYPRQYFDDHLQNHQFQHKPNPYSKLDLDFSKPAEAKRQVSFKFDVEALSSD